MYLIKLFLVLCFICVSNGKNVLIIQCVFTRSYSNILEGIANVLATEHNVTLISRHPTHEAHPNVTLIQFPEIQVDVGGKFKDLYSSALVEDDTSQFIIDVGLFVSKEYVGGLLDNSATKYILQTKVQYDILIMPTILSGAFVRFAHVLNVPLVQVSTSYPLPWQNEAIGNPIYLSTDPSLFLPPSTDNFYGRLKKFIKGIKLLYHYHYDYLPKLDKLTDKYFPLGTPKTNDVLMNTSLLLVNTQAEMSMLKPKVPNYLEIGGLHCRPPRELSSDLKQFVESAEHGVIYMSLGLTISSTFPQHILQSILNVFRQLPQKVIMKTEQKLNDVPENVLILKSCPQQDILGHRNTKLFITQGGILSLQEAVYHQVPVLVLPITADQPTSAILADKLGYGTYLRFSKFSEDLFLRSIARMLSNPKYMERIKEISALTKDKLYDPEENLKWWINHIIRHRKPKINRSGYNPPIYHIDVDIIIFFISLTATILFLILFIVKFILNNVKIYGKIKKE